MSILQRIRSWFSGGNDDAPKPVSNTAHLRNLLVEARRQQYMEQYTQALETLTEAMALAEKEYDLRSKVDITLSRADILIEQGDYDTANFILGELRDDSEAREMTAPLAYALCSLGVVTEKQGNLEGARDYFEKARATAQSIQTDGATGRAEAHLAEIYLAEGNASYAIYLLEEAIKKLNRSGDRELLGYFNGQLGLAYIANGDAPTGRTKLQHGLDVAMNLRHRAQIRHLSVLLGDQALDESNYQKAHSYYDDALRLYTDEIPRDERYAHLLSRISMASLRLGDSESALQHAQDALPIAHAHDNPNLVAQTMAVHALALEATGAENASHALNDAVEAYEALEADAFLVDVLRVQAKSQTESVNAQVESYQRAIEVAEAMPATVAKIHSDLATVYAEARRFREAIVAWQMAIDNLQSANHTQSIASIHSDIAGIYDLLGDGNMAQREYRAALEQLSRVDDSAMRGVVLANVAAGYSEYGDIETAVAFFEETIGIAKRLRHAPAEAVRRGNYGRLLALTNRPKEALGHLFPARTLCDEHDLTLQAGVIENNIGLAYIALTEYNKARDHLENAEAIVERLDMPDWIARTMVNQADLARLQDDNVLADNLYRDVYGLAKEHKLIAVMIQTLVGQARLALAEGDLETTGIKLDNAEPVAKRLGHRRLLALMTEVQSRLLSAQGDAESAQSKWQEAEKLRTIMRMPELNPDWLAQNTG
ncbi:MAG: tetratricopeptide repeat protein [Chloroflexota bacterium]